MKTVEIKKFSGILPDEGEAKGLTSYLNSIEGVTATQEGVKVTVEAAGIDAEWLACRYEDMTMRLSVYREYERLFPEGQDTGRD